MSRRQPRAGPLLLCLAAASLMGCPPPAPKSLLPLEALVGGYNANAAAVPQLWARAKLVVTFADEKGRTVTWGSTLLAPNATLVMAKGHDKLGPHYFVLVGTESGHPVFRLGSSPDEPGGPVYYFWAHMGDSGIARFGRQEFAGAPGIDEMPIDPNGLLSVLGVFELPDDFTRLPTVALTMSESPYAYVLRCVDVQPVSGRILFRREVYFNWSDKAPPRAYKVNLLAADGRRMMTATLSDYKPVETGQDGGPRPVMPTDIRVQWASWPDRPAGVRNIHLVLSGMTATGRGNPRDACLFRGNLPAGLAPVQVDRHLEPKGGRS